MQVNFIPHLGFISSETASVKPARAHLLAQYMLKVGIPFCPAMLEICCIRPPGGFCSRMTCIAFLVTLMHPKKLTLICCDICASSSSSNGPQRPNPALLTTTSTRPKVFRATSNALLTDSVLVTSRATGTKFSGFEAANFKLFGYRVVATTLSPLAIISSTRFLPNPLEVHVTKKIRPAILTNLNRRIPRD